MANQNIIYTCGHYLNLASSVRGAFNKIDTEVLTANLYNGCFYFDENDIYKLKNSNNEVVPDGRYRFKSNTRSIYINNWDPSNYYLVAVKNGVVTTICSEGHYIDFKSKRAIYCAFDGWTGPSMDGVYFNNATSIYNVSNGIAYNLKDGVYVYEKDGLTRIIKSTEGIIEPFFGHVFIPDSKKIYYKNAFIGVIPNGGNIVCEDKIIYNINDTLKYVSYNDL